MQNNSDFDQNTAIQNNHYNDIDFDQNDSEYSWFLISIHQNQWITKVVRSLVNQHSYEQSPFSIGTVCVYVMWCNVDVML